MLQAKVINTFRADSSPLPIQIVAILPCKQSLFMPPLPTETFILRPKRIDDSKMVKKKLSCGLSIPRLYIMALLTYRYMTLPQYHSRQRWPQQVSLLLYSDVTTGVFFCCIDRTKT